MLAEKTCHLRQIFHRLVSQHLSAIADDSKATRETGIRKNGTNGRLPVRKREWIGGSQIDQRLVRVDLVVKRH
jgi:hypothetical protein